MLTSTPTIRYGDSQTSRFEFLLLRYCLHPKRDLVLCSLSRTNPASPAVFTCRIPNGILLRFDSRDVYHCPIIFSRSPDFAKAPSTWLNFARIGCLIHRLGWVVDQLYCNIKPS